MTKKDYERVAAVMKGVFEVAGARESPILEHAVHKLAMAFKEDNDRFDYDLFMRKCGHPRFQPKGG